MQANGKIVQMREKIYYGTLLMSMVLLVMLSAEGLWSETGRLRTDIIAIVDKRYLRKGELDQRVEKLLALEGEFNREKENEDSFRRYSEGRIVEEWIHIALLAREAEENGFTVTDEEIEKKIEELRVEYAPNLDIETALKRAGYTRDQYIQEMRDAILGEKLIHDYIRKKYTEKQLREIYNLNQEQFIFPPSVRVLHIFRSIPRYASKDQKKRIYDEMNELRKRALKGEDFRELAKQSDAYSRYKGGDLGWLTPNNRLPEPVNGVVFEVKPGRISKVILDKREYGYHLIKVLEKRPASGTTFEEARKNVELLVFDQEKEQLLERLKAKYRVVINFSGIPESIAFSPSPSKTP